MKRFACGLALAALLCIVAGVSAQCRGGSCGGSSQPMFAPAPTPSFEWCRFADDDGQIALFYGGQQVGGYSFRDDGYRSLRPDGSWSDWCPSPINPPDPPVAFSRERLKAPKEGTCDKCGPKCKCGRGSDCRCQCGDGCDCGDGGQCPDCSGQIGAVDGPNFGMNWKPPEHERWNYSGRIVDWQTGLRAIAQASDGIPDDGGLPWLNVTGTQAERKQVVDDLSGKLAGLAAKYRIHAYDPSSKMVEDRHWPNSGHPTITIHAARGMAIWVQNSAGQYVKTTAQGGEIIHEQETYDGPDELARVMTRCAADANPDLRNPAKPVPVPVPFPVPMPEPEPPHAEPVDYSSHACCAVIPFIAAMGLYLLKQGKK